MSTVVVNQSGADSCQSVSLLDINRLIPKYNKPTILFVLQLVYDNRNLLGHRYFWCP